MSRPPRIPGYAYVGVQRYFLTTCTLDRATYFTDPATVWRVRDHFLQSAAAGEFAVLVYCVMPDHAHLLVEGMTDRAEMKPFVKDAKQQSGVEFRRLYGRSLWQEGYHDHVLRDEESTRAIIAYIVMNPVRKGLVADPADYPYWGSTAYTREEILRFIGEARPPRYRRN